MRPESGDRTRQLFGNEPPQRPARMSQLVATARQLRKTRAACRKFLALWALEEGHKKSPKQGNPQEKLLNDPMNHDWSLLYLGSILDD